MAGWALLLTQPAPHTGPSLCQDVKRLAVKQHGDDYRAIVHKREADRQQWEDIKEVRSAGRTGWLKRLDAWAAG